MVVEEHRVLVGGDIELVVFLEHVIHPAEWSGKQGVVAASVDEGDTRIESRP